ncbi:MAG: hypothetical protein ABFC56_06720 [Clostridiaceae bacterium]
MSTAATTLEKLRNTPNLVDVINKILAEKFIYAKPVAEILASAIYSKQNVILYGPGGHGKSEMVECALEGLGLWNRQDPANSSALIQSFGEGLTEDALWGGIDFRKLNSPTDPEMWFNVENSFLRYPVAVFEELFDAPAFCLLPLKHTLQAKFLAKNGRSYPMQTELIIACTNRNPDEIAEMGETYRALLERFVLRQEVVWKSYNMSDYQKLLQKHPLASSITNQNLKMLASLMNECYEAGDFISPRTAMKAMDIVYGAAVSRGSKSIEPEDFAALTHVAGFQRAASTFLKQLESKLAEAEARVAMEKVEQEFHQAKQRLESGSITKVVEWCMLSKLMLRISDRFSELSVPDSLFERRGEFVQQCSEFSTHCLHKARDITRI